MKVLKGILFLCVVSMVVSRRILKSLSNDLEMLILTAEGLGSKNKWRGENLKMIDPDWKKRPPPETAVFYPRGISILLVGRNTSTH